MHSRKVPIILVSCLSIIMPGATSSLNCMSSAFTFPDVFGAQGLSVNAAESRNYTGHSINPGTTETGVYTIDFCNVTVTYNHPGWHDTIHVNVWLPLGDWNDRLWALGGGGFSASLGPMASIQAVAKGYVAIDTDAGHSSDLSTALSADDWALTSVGNVNLYLLEDFASRSLGEMTIIGKHITKEYYGSKPKRSYFAGCSGGGRQGLMIAQRFPQDYDGILTAAPAIKMDSVVTVDYWATQVMNRLKVFPPPCEIGAFTQEAIAACDELDGIRDGIISIPRLCDFDAMSVVGKEFSCNDTTRQLTLSGAEIVQAAWNGPAPQSAELGWYGLNKDAALTTNLVATTCDAQDKCSAASVELLGNFIKNFVVKDLAFNLSSMTDEDFFRYLRLSEREYKSIIGTSDPDLSEFKAAGGRMITWHGLADETLPPAGVAAYYREVLDIDPKAHEYYRFFEAPGVAHCAPGAGPVPIAAFDQLIAWVEEGVAPAVLNATSEKNVVRPLCPYPLEQRYIGGDPEDFSSFQCSSQLSGRMIDQATYI